MKNVLISLFMLTALFAGAQSPEIEVMPTMLIPLGSDAELYDFGFGAKVDVNFDFHAIKPFAGLGFNTVPTQSGSTLYLPNARLGVKTIFYPTSRLGLGANAGGGMYYGIFSPSNGDPEKSFMNFMAFGGVDLSFRMTSALSLNAGATYVAHLNGSEEPLHQGLNIDLTLNFASRGFSGEANTRIEEVSIPPLFPVLYTQYTATPIGSTRITNNENAVIENIEVLVHIPQYMEQPFISAQIDKLEPGEGRDVDLFALLTEDVLSTTEGTKVQADIIVNYTLLSDRKNTSKNESIKIHHRNALSWDDDKKAAAFVTSKDPEVLRYAKYVAGLVRQQPSGDIDKHLLLAIGLFESLSDYGCNYVIDPTSAYADFSSSEHSLDYVQFPAQTLNYRGGDCDDLSILFTALLEAAGVESAFITIPGHIYTAFKLEMTPDKIKRFFQDDTNFIIRDDEVWVPLEITLLHDGFLKAWQIGAKEWNDNNANEQADFFAMSDSWKTYDPVGLPGNENRVALPESTSIVNSFKTGLDKFIAHQIGGQVEKMEAIIASRSDNIRFKNRLGILYARYGMYNEASRQFQEIAKKGYLPAMINLGNISYLLQDYQKANDYFQLALAKEPENPTALIGIARTQYELESYKDAAVAYESAKLIAPEAAEQYSYILSISNGAARASSAAARTGGAAWAEEEE